MKTHQSNVSPRKYWTAGRKHRRIDVGGAHYHRRGRAGGSPRPVIRVPMDVVDSGEVFDLEAKRRDDDSWHPCRVILRSLQAFLRVSRIAVPPMVLLTMRFVHAADLGTRTHCEECLVLCACIQANSGRRRRSTITSDTVSLINQSNSRRITRSQTKANAELVKHCDSAPLLNPLAAQAALASLVHGQLAGKQEPSIFGLQDCLSDLPLNVEKKQDDHPFLEIVGR
ncbi:hypothetical protein BHM03_00018785 [Ensete ventricosum]|uniref:SAWADEE domain-containing protein n=1 Tax=Ensete ventricosum TaxID=4639 RepID=A0A445MFB3_ENSVE|nr:hypothetical protein BHM03_00018785 [Ensete ventricosum]